MRNISLLETDSEVARIEKLRKEQKKASFVYIDAQFMQEY